MCRSVRVLFRLDSMFGAAPPGYQRHLPDTIDIPAPAPVVWTSKRAIGDFCPASPVPRPGDPLPAPGQAQPGPAPRREPRVSRRHSFGRRFAADCMVGRAVSRNHDQTVRCVIEQACDSFRQGCHSVAAGSMTGKQNTPLCAGDPGSVAGNQDSIDICAIGVYLDDSNADGR